MIAFLLKYKYLIAIVLLVLGGFFYIKRLETQLATTRESLSVVTNNAKAYELGMTKWEDRYGQEHAKTIMFNENLTNFKESQDSITKQLIGIINDQGISLNKLRQAALINTKVSTSLVKEINTKLPDTAIDLSNKYVKNIVRLSPYKITSDIELYNTQAILTTDSTYKVFYPYRYKFFLKRWFQEKEKETLLNIEVINSNPLIKTEQQKFITIIKHDK